MKSRIGAYARQHHLALLCLFLIIGGGTAWAVDRNSVRSKHIVNGQVKTPDLKGGAVKAGKIADNAVRANKVLDESLGGADINEDTLGKVPNADTLDNNLGEVMWAVVKSDVSIARSSPGVDVTGCLNGCYRVFFPRPVADCAWVASPSSPDTTDPAGGFVTGRVDVTSNGLRIFTHNTAGNGVFVNFHVIVTCPST